MNDIYGTDPVETRPIGVPRLQPREFVRAHPLWLVVIALIIVGLISADAALIYKGQGYGLEIDRLRRGMSGVERQRADVVFAANKDQLRVMVALIRRQSEGDRALHLSVAVDRGEMYLEREGVRLRVMPVRVGPDAIVGQGAKAVPVAAPRGQRTVASISPWSIALDGGMKLYADSGRDSLPQMSVTPGNVLLEATDLKAIIPDVKPGMAVYFY